MTAFKGQRILGISFLLTLAFCILEFVGGRLSGSLALLADAGHMLTDLGALGLAFFSGWMATKRPTSRMSYGYYRIEVLSALLNGALLIAIAIFIVIEAYERFSIPHEINPILMMAVALAGLVFDLFNGFLLKRSATENINVRGAFFHVMADAISSIGTLAAGLIILFTGWTPIDAVISSFIALLIILSAFRLLKDVAEVLLEATPGRIDLEALEAKILSSQGIRSLHDLHVWSLSPGKEALSAHLEVTEGVNRDKILENVNDMLSRDFGIDHTTLQIETPAQREKEKSHFHD